MSSNSVVSIHTAQSVVNMMSTVLSDFALGISTFLFRCLCSFH